MSPPPLPPPRLLRAAAAALLLLVLLAPLADAKGSSGGWGGRRSCTPVDTDGDGAVSDQERADQCGDDSWVPLAFAGGAAAIAGGIGLAKRGQHRFGAGGGRLDLKAGGGVFLAGYKGRVVGRLRYRNDAGDTWDEWCLDLDGRRFWLEDDEGTLWLHKPWNARAALNPPTVDGQRVRVAEEGGMKLVSSTGVSGVEAQGTYYVDGKLPDGRRVSLDAQGANIEVFLSSPATARGNQVSLKDPAFIG